METNVNYLNIPWPMEPKEYLLQQEARLQIATETNDVVELDRLLHDELLFTDQQGRLFTKAMDLDVHRSGALVIDMLRVNEYQIRLISDVAVITSLTYLTGKHSEQILAGTFRYNRVWKNDGSNCIPCLSCIRPLIYCVLPKRFR